MSFWERAKKIGQDVHNVAKNPFSAPDIILDRVVESGIAKGNAGEILKKIDQRGMIDIVPSDRKMAGILTKIKTGSGPLGRPFNIDFESNPDTMAYLQNQINRAKQEGNQVIYSHKNGTAIKPETPEDQQAMAIVGQFIGDIQPDGTVTTRDHWDVNSDATTLWNRWHDKSIDPKDRTFYRNAFFGKLLQYSGLVNSKPFGEEFKIGYAPGTEQARKAVSQNIYSLEGQRAQNKGESIVEGQLTKAKETLMPKAVASTPSTAMNKTYKVQQGDNLSTIAAKNNVDLQDLIKKNNISNPNMLYVGDVLNL